MSNEEYQQERKRLLKIHEDAVDRGDYYLEMDVLAVLHQLNEIYYSED